ncbi:MAG: TetR/AcrR family transcriptional regulator [Bacteroidota bacterium]
MIQLTVRLSINDKLFLRDPEKTKLGKRIIRHSIKLIDEYGIEEFTFKKLAEEIQSTEASIYRYFENKYLLFVYLVNWYWEWMKFRVGFRTMNLNDPVKKLRIAIGAILDISQTDTAVDYVNTELLHQIVVVEGTKAYHKKSVDEENKYGFFLSYKALCKRIADIIVEVNPSYQYPRSLASMLLETANNNIYFAQHLPRLTDIKYQDGYLKEIETMLLQFALGCIDSNKPSLATNR